MSTSQGQDEVNRATIESSILPRLSLEERKKMHFLQCIQAISQGCVVHFALNVVCTRTKALVDVIISRSCYST